MPLPWQNNTKVQSQFWKITSLTNGLTTKQCKKPLKAIESPQKLKIILESWKYQKEKLTAVKTPPQQQEKAPENKQQSNQEEKQEEQKNNQQQSDQDQQSAEKKAQQKKQQAKDFLNMNRDEEAEEEARYSRRAFDLKNQRNKPNKDY